ncbi:hypothetical protein [Colwellia echini]|uniref:DUF3828 domain-containing protein n=1 Tax=Colwellia echini TaxID=1982103 RepID=A0ABY3MSH0_9GAMM|nr:hypothetical protein [Colwellia echini]TYK64141.1 hypothetical protein CWS31_017245 [Colwellia echini]
MYTSIIMENIVLAKLKITLFILCTYILLPSAHAQHMERDLVVSQTMFSYLIEHNGSYQGTSAPVYFLKLYQADPPKSLLDKFNEARTVIKPSSMANIGPPREKAITVYDADTGNTGVILNIHSIKWSGENSVLVKAGYYEGLRSSEIKLYTLQFINGQWTVVKSQQLSVS